MAPKLYTTDLSPPARSVLLTGAALGLELEEIHVDLFKREHRSPDFVKVRHRAIFYCDVELSILTVKSATLPADSDRRGWFCYLG